MGGVRTLFTDEVIPPGGFTEPYDVGISCDSDEFLLDVTLSAGADIWVYGWIIEIVPTSAYETTVSMGRDDNSSTPFRIYWKCLGTGA